MIFNVIFFKVVKTGKSYPKTLVFPESEKGSLPGWIVDTRTKVVLNNESLKGK